MPYARSFVHLAVPTAALMMLPINGHGQSATAPVDSTPKVRVGAFIDGYYAWDTGRPTTRDRSFAGGALFGTQPARHNEFNVNLAFVDVTLDGPRTHGRLAVQYGTSVQANYAGEPTRGVVSGPGVQQYLQEAFAGVRLGARTWVDGGIFFSNMGMESWISRDNVTYTRSLVADFSPYYSTGVRLTHQASATVALRLDVVNGWQNISENNDGKGGGLRVDWTPAATSAGDATLLSYYNFASEEAGTRTRLFNGVGANITRGRVTLLGQADVGVQRRRAEATGWSRWTGVLAAARVRVTPTVAFAGRVEHYDDPDQVILATGAISDGASTRPNPAFTGSSASLGIDVRPAPATLWRTEVRGFRTTMPLFPDGACNTAQRNSAVLVTSLAVTF